MRIGLTLTILPNVLARRELPRIPSASSSSFLGKGNRDVAPSDPASILPVVRNALRSVGPAIDGDAVIMRRGAGW